MASKDIVKHQFKIGFDPKRNNNGAPRKLISSLSNTGYNNREITDTMLNILALTKAEIDSIAENESYSILERLVAKAILKDFSKGSLYNVDTLMNRAIGKPKETTSIEKDNKIEVTFIKGKTIL